MAVRTIQDRADLSVAVAADQEDGRQPAADELVLDRAADRKDRSDEDTSLDLAEARIAAEEDLEDAQSAQLAADDRTEDPTEAVATSWVPEGRSLAERASCSRLDSAAAQR